METIASPSDYADEEFVSKTTKPDTYEYLPKLKSPGKSACKVEVISIESCNLDRSTLKMFLTALDIDDKPGKVLQDRTIVRNRKPKDDSFLLKWAVRKTAFQHSSQDGARFLKQLKKQSLYFQQSQSTPILRHTFAPEIYSVTKKADGSVVADMQYVPFPDCVSFFLNAPKEQLFWFLDSIINFVDSNLENAEFVALSSIMPAFEQKQKSIENALSGSILTKKESEFVKNCLDSKMKYFHETENLDILIPIGRCHGDLTMLNILVDSSSRKLCFLDFLDCFVESPLQDIAKLLQEFRHYWLLTQIDQKTQLIRIMSILQSLKTLLSSSYESFEFWKAVPLFEIFCIARIIPYTTEIHEKECLLAAMRRMMDGADMILSSSLPETKSVPGQVSMIIPALGDQKIGDEPSKYLKKFPNGLNQLTECLKFQDLENVSVIYLAILEYTLSYTSESEILSQIENAYGAETASKFQLVIFEEKTQDAAATVELVIKKSQIEGPIYVKDVSSCFDHPIKPGNYVCVADAMKTSVHGYDLKKKSYCTIRQDNLLSNISEKAGLTSLFSAGGYSFLDAEAFLWSLECIRHFQRDSKSSSRVYISDVLYLLSLHEVSFFAVDISSYCDWGSLTSWNQYARQFLPKFIHIGYLDNVDASTLAELTLNYTIPNQKIVLTTCTVLPDETALDDLIKSCCGSRSRTQVVYGCPNRIAF